MKPIEKLKVIRRNRYLNEIAKHPHLAINYDMTLDNDHHRTKLTVARNPEIANQKYGYFTLYQPLGDHLANYYGLIKVPKTYRENMQSAEYVHEAFLKFEELVINGFAHIDETTLLESKPLAFEHVDSIPWTSNDFMDFNRLNQRLNNLDENWSNQVHPKNNQINLSKYIDDVWCPNIAIINPATMELTLNPNHESLSDTELKVLSDYGNQFHLALITKTEPKFNADSIITLQLTKADCDLLIDKLTPHEGIDYTNQHLIHQIKVGLEQSSHLYK